MAGEEQNNLPEGLESNLDQAALAHSIIESLLDHTKTEPQMNAD